MVDSVWIKKIDLQPHDDDQKGNDAVDLIGSKGESEDVRYVDDEY